MTSFDESFRITQRVGEVLHSVDFQALALAILAAVFAFLFFLLGQLILRAYERTRQHHVALVNLQFVLNSQLDEIAENKNNVSTIKKLNFTKGNLIISLPRRLSAFSPQILNALLDDFTLNETFSLMMELRTYNNYIENFNESYLKLRDVYLDNTITKDRYAEEAAKSVKGYINLVDSLLVYERKIKRLMAITQLEKPAISKAIDHVIREYMIQAIRLTDEDIDKKLKEVEKQIEEVKARAKKDYGTKKPKETGWRRVGSLMVPVDLKDEE